MTLEEPDTVRMPEAWESYLTAAQQLMQGVHLLAKGDHKAAPARAFLSAQVLECALKSFLSKVDPQLNLKDNDIRHDLEMLWKEAQAHDLPVNPSPHGWVKTLNSLHDKPYAIRYWEKINGMILLRAQPMTDDLQVVLDTIGAKVKEA